MDYINPVQMLGFVRSRPLRELIVLSSEVFFLNLFLRDCVSAPHTDKKVSYRKQIARQHSRWSTP